MSKEYVKAFYINLPVWHPREIGQFFPGTLMPPPYANYRNLNSIMEFFKQLHTCKMLNIYPTHRNKAIIEN